NQPFPNLYHEVRELGKLISANTTNAQGLGTPISRPPGTILVVHIRHPLTKKMIVIKKLIKVPDRKGTYTIKAPFYIQVAKLKALHQIQNSYKRSTHKVESNKDEYEIKKGQDLYTIAKMYDTTWQILAQLNKSTIKDPNKIVPGQVIKVPPKGSSLTGKTNDRPDSLTSQTHYKVKKGDTLSSISQRSGVSVEQLQRMNGITDPTTLQADQTIKLRSDGSAQTHTTPKPSSTPTPISTSKPSSSDKEENGFFDGAMDAAADIVKGTAGAIGGAFETIGNGLGALGDKAKGELEDLNEAMSGGENDKPSGGAPAASTNSGISSSSTSGSYTVKNGDTLSGIARKHGVNTNDLARANGLKITDIIHPGDKLKILTGGATSSSTSSSSQPSKPDIPVNVTTKPSNSSDGTPKDITTTNGSCICKAHDLIWGKKFNCDERLKVIEICQNLWPNNYLKTANNLMAIFSWESGEKFETGTPNKRNSGGTGLIQIMPSTYKNLTGKEPIFETVYNYWGLGKNLRRVKQLAD
ncbi:LysM peptidoglycan-binding domain-containing protein, partial [Psychrobacter sp. AOP5-GZ1-6]